MTLLEMLDSHERRFRQLQELSRAADEALPFMPETWPAETAAKRRLDEALRRVARAGEENGNHGDD